MSRPKKPIGTHLAITAIRMPPQVKVKLEALSAQTGLAQQEHIRRALDAYFFDLESKGQFDPKTAKKVKDTVHVRRPYHQVQPEIQQARKIEEARQGAIQTIQEARRRIFRRPGSIGASA